MGVVSIEWRWVSDERVKKFLIFMCGSLLSAEAFLVRFILFERHCDIWLNVL